MRIATKKAEQAEVGGFEQIDARIREEDLGFMLNMTSKNLYSNPIGAFIREIVSNAVDANVDTDTKNPIQVKVFEEDDQWYITIQDEGTGMTREVFDRVYMSWGSSDKRDTDKKIGGWGLGSKSPLSYQDSFEITTIAEGIKYEYQFINQEPKPTALILGDEETDEISGTTIRIMLETDDLYEVGTECTKQLAYFDNVYVTNENTFYDNNFKIYESKTFKLRTGTRPFEDEMHIVLGQVAYPINWKVLGMDAIKIPVAIKFDVSELEVQLSRESIKYGNDEVKRFIKDRIKAVEEDLIEMHSKGMQMDDLESYVNELRRTYRTDYLNIKEIKIDMTSYKVPPTFAPLGVRFVKKYKENLFNLYSLYYISNGVHSSMLISDDFPSRHSGYLAKGNMNMYDSAFLDNGYVLKRGKLTKDKMVGIARMLGMTTKVEGTYSWQDNVVLKDGAARKVHEFIKYFDNYIDSKYSSYTGQADEEWIEDYKRKAREDATERKLSLTVYNLYNKRDNIRLGYLMDSFKYVLYISKKESNQHKAKYTTMYNALPSWFTKDTKFIIINPSVIKRIRRKKGFIPMESIFKAKALHNFFRRLKIATFFDAEILPHTTKYRYSSYYQMMYYKLRRVYFSNMPELSKQYSEVPYTSEGGYSREETINTHLYVCFNKEIDALAPKVMKYTEYFEPLKAFNESMEGVNYFSEDITPKYVNLFLKSLKITKLNLKYYNSNLKPQDNGEQETNC